MTCETKNIFKTAAVYTGTVLGAGFASGKELVSFFVCHGMSGIFGMLLSGVFFSLIGFCVLKIVYERKITNYHDFSVYIFGEKLGVLSEWLVCAFLLVLFSAMISAGGEMSHTVFKISRLKGEIILSLLCFITFLFQLDGFVDINTLLAPILVIGGIFTGIYIYISPPEAAQTFKPLLSNFLHTKNFVTSSLIYVSYNIITAVTVLVSLNSLISSKKVSVLGGTLGGVCVCLLGISMSLPLFSQYSRIHSAQMPILNIVLDYNILKYIYVIILLSAIFTTALANGFSLIQNFENKKGGKLFIKIFLTLWGIAAAQIGFSTFIEHVYPFFGIIGLFEGIMIIRAAIRKA